MIINNYITVICWWRDLCDFLLLFSFQVFNYRYNRSNVTMLYNLSLRVVTWSLNNIVRKTLYLLCLLHGECGSRNSRIHITVYYYHLPLGRTRVTVVMYYPFLYCIIILKFELRSLYPCKTINRVFSETGFICFQKMLSFRNYLNYLSIKYLNFILTVYNIIYYINIYMYLYYYYLPNTNIWISLTIRQLFL